ncbi:ferritin-like-domain-containing protein [Hygrophoropsis aurantiaca]|uniref:Ferritin-like-domain-containing protein n=1 Tax=Hygrophoropsis aurantiaca TaxID=72124 RepID=A0ACB8A8Q4_9AGAM|nr:ferritin-like-domain-containing protein [Hygrophoropsis aurantiaca]
MPSPFHSSCLTSRMVTDLMLRFEAALSIQFALQNCFWSMTSYLSNETFHTQLVTEPVSHIKPSRRSFLVPPSLFLEIPFTMASSKTEMSRDEVSETLKAQIIEKLHIAIAVELSTIPLYLYSMYSIKKDNGAGTAARAKIAVVVHQEMLHLALAGNLLVSLKEGPDLYSDIQYIPNYANGPTILDTKIPLTLEPCGKTNLERFISIEAPYQDLPQKAEGDEEHADMVDKSFVLMSLPDKEPNTLKGCKSIGLFYDKLEEDIKKCEHVKFGNHALQFSSTDFFSGQMIRVVDQKSAHEALKIIVDQGEGSVDVDQAHYQMFLDLYMKPMGWTCWPVPTKPTTSAYKSNPLAHELALASNAAFCYLLITIQKIWKVGDPVLRRSLMSSIHAIMVDVMNPLADFMVQCKWTDDHNTGPPFEHYKTKAGEELTPLVENAKKETNDAKKAEIMAKIAEITDEAARELQKGILDHLQNIIDANIGKHIDKAGKTQLKAIVYSINSIPWPERIMHINT